MSVARMSTASRAPSRRSETASATAIAPLPVPTSTIRSGWDEPAVPRAQGPHGGRKCELDQSLRLGSRDQRPGVDLEREPVELLEPTQICDGLAGGAALDVGAVSNCGVEADRRLGVRQNDRPPDADGVPQQELRVEPWRLGPGCLETLRALLEERSGALDGDLRGGSRPVRRRRQRRRVDRPGRP